MTVWVFGDSLSLPFNLPADCVSWGERLSQRLRGTYKNFARPAADNFYIYACYQAHINEILPQDVVVVGWSHHSRKTFVLDETNPRHQQVLPHSLVYDDAPYQYFRSCNPPDFSLAKWIGSRLWTQSRGNLFYDTWFRDYYSDHEQHTNLVAYYHAVANTCPGRYVPFFFNKDSLGGTLLHGAGYAMEFISENHCAISEVDHHFNSLGHELWADKLWNYLDGIDRQQCLPVIELCDRYVIAQIKHDRIGSNTEELEFYQQQMYRYDLSSVQDLLQQLKDIHLSIWDLEKELKSGREHELPLEEIGRRAIQIRDKNNIRIHLKNTLAEKLGCAVREIKKDHCSE
jgi:hypothetical protein